MTYLECVRARLEISDVNPLTINVVGVGVRAAGTDALVTVVGTLEHRLRPWQAVVILQTK